MPVQQSARSCCEHAERARLGYPTALDELRKTLERLRDGSPKVGCTTLLLLDLHKFKRINRIYGHASGSALHTRIAKRLAHVCGSVPMFQLGSDEFAFLHSGAHSCTPEELAGALLAAVDIPIKVKGNAIRLSAAIGLASHRDVDGTVEQFLDLASIALSQARKGAGGKSAYHAIDASQSPRLDYLLACELPDALRNGDVHPYYQPIVSLAHNTVTGYEALARWQHPEHGLLLPDTFLPIAEELGLMDELLLTMVEQSCRDMQSLPGPVNVAMNLSPHQLDGESIVARLLAVIDASGIASRMITLEVTEDKRTEDSEATRRSIDALRSAGIKIALDDFGSGYANLQRLAQFPPDSLKIDRALTRACDSDMGKRLLTSVIELGHRLHLPIIAEGIETPAQARCLTDMGCDYAQGFLFGHPQPCDKLLETPDFSSNG
ncbi:GGDEF domain-containing protein [Novosphingobium profundi]|uniref:putative bifunctional diguanylate cyclase/phosphodiesterase n=1 Tax=Novosphingobium profundi TaxID=1774954 RepID=UPI001BD98D81|nr:bifunctional diguanylate cyclase/phosphodiesterase [Novosphingobium profundi]MBT0670535.1 GGDEF domain-containing protein [Novosphingobium profundi]